MEMSEPCPRQAPRRSQKAVFLDRDGTLNINFGYVHRIEDWVWIDGATAGLKALHRADFALVVVTNQAGIARGFYNNEQVIALHDWMQSELAVLDISLAGVYFCPHHPEFGDKRACNCRKPQPGMLWQAAADLELDLSSSWIIGDSLTDAQAGLAAGTRAILLADRALPNIDAAPNKPIDPNVIVVPDWHEAVANILASA